MSAEASQQIKELFDAAFDLAPEARERFLGEACAGNDGLLAEVQKLLLLHDEADEFLAAPPLVNDSSPAIHADAALGRRIGAYQVIRELGRGGMGAVFLAHRADQTFEKQVAIKLVWPGLGSDEIIQRFQQERQILARLEHPNIARLLDGGVTEDGWHYLVMEYIAGVPITQYCQGLALPERLRLFRAVCEAVQFAHQNLVIHRDLKPSNILVTNDGAPKLLDFGIAKLLEQNEASLALTHTQLPLTPEYASPEQLNNQPLTTATDIYSLGVVLYEMLTGRKPYRFKTPLLHEIARVVTEDEPDKPNLDDELANIVLMAMRKEAARRYLSVELFQLDIGRYLDGKTVLAHKPTTSYRVGKFVRRHKLPVLLAGLLLLTLVTVALVSLWQASLAREQARGQRRTLYATQMNQAVQDWELGNLSRMRETLEAWLPTAGQEDLRGFEWRYLWGLIHREQHTLRLKAGQAYDQGYFDNDDRHVVLRTPNLWQVWDATTGILRHEFDLKEYQTSILFHSGQQYWALAAKENTIHFLDPVAKQLMNSFTVVPHRFLGLGHIPDQVVTSHDDGSLQYWDCATGQRLATRTFGTEPINAFLFSWDYKWLLTRTGAETWHLWDYLKQRKITSFVQAAAFAPRWSHDCKYIFLRTENIVRMFETATGRELPPLGSDTNKLLFADFLHSSNYFYILDSASAINLYRTPTFQLAATLKGHQGWVFGVAESPDQKLLASTSSDLTVRLWDLVTQKELMSFRPHEYRAALAFSADGSRLLTWSNEPADLTARIWRVTDLLRPDQLTGHQGHVFSVAFSPDGKTLATASEDHTIKLWDVNTGANVRTLAGHTNWVFAATFVPDGKWLVSGGEDHAVILWDIATGRELGRFAGHAQPVRSVAIAPDGSLLATCDNTGNIKLWNLSTGRELFTMVSERRGPEVFSVAFSPDGQRLVSASADQTARVWDVRNGHELLTLRGHSASVWTAKFSPDGQTIATGSTDRTIKLWNATTGGELATLRGHSNDIFSLAWSPDGTRLATASNDKTVRLWNVPLGLEVLMLRQHSEQVWTVAFSPDGTHLASGSWDKTVRLWRAATP
jgi:WD40 repeat protein